MIRTRLLVFATSLFPFLLQAQQHAGIWPSVKPAGDTADVVYDNMRRQAVKAAQRHLLPQRRHDWEQRRAQLKAFIMEKAGIDTNHALPLDLRETGSIKMEGYTVKQVYFQTRPGVYATANLYVPGGKGPFPAVVTMCGHSRNGRFYDNYQSIGHTLALNGYVSLVIDPWGAGERTTAHGLFEYHGASLGASLLETGHTLLGMQVTDNMRGVDLLASLPYVDASRIGATGASGGGNQTMWLAAMDERVKAAVPVVSVGTFEAYVMRSNCVCELLPDGLTATEEAGVLALVAPRAIKLCNGTLESNPSFYPAEMLRSYRQALPVFKMLGAAANLGYEIFPLKHGYWPPNRAAMLGWFNKHLKGKGNGEAVKEKPFSLLPEEKLMAFPQGQRDTLVKSTAAFCSETGAALHRRYLQSAAFDTAAKRAALRQLLKITPTVIRPDATPYEPANGWHRTLLQAGSLPAIPLLYMLPANPAKGFVICCHPGGKDSIGRDMVQAYRQAGYGVALPDLWGCGEAASAAAMQQDASLGRFHTLARSALWLGKTMEGEWAQQLQAVRQYLHSNYQPAGIITDASKETALAALSRAALYGGPDSLVLRNAPVSCVFDNSAGADYYGMAIHIPRFLQWGDVSLLAALGGQNTVFLQPRTMSGATLAPAALQQYRTEFEQARHKCGQGGQTQFILQDATPGQTAKAVIAYDDTRTTKWDTAFRLVHIPGAGNYRQPAYFYATRSARPQPLVVSLHTWSGNYTQADSIAGLSRRSDVNYIHPDFRGPNKTSQACSSPLAIADIDAAIDYAIGHGNVDTSRIYVVGVSGGGMATLNVFLHSRHRIRKFSAWVPIADLEAWYNESRIRKNGYANDILLCTSAGAKELDVAEARRRSPLYAVTPTGKLSYATLHIFAGVYDGIQGSVPITHSINFYNKVLADLQVPKTSGDYVSDAEKLFLLEYRKPLKEQGKIGEREICLLKKHGNIQLLIFRGNHEMLPEQAFEELIP